jgi:hypothetical protein
MGRLKRSWDTHRRYAPLASRHISSLPLVHQPSMRSGRAGSKSRGASGVFFEFWAWAAAADSATARRARERRLRGAFIMVPVRDRFRCV